MGSTDALQSSTGIPLVLDIALVLLLFVAKVGLLAGILTLVSRQAADVSLKKCTLTAAVLGIAYFLFNTMPEALFSVRTFLLVSLAGALFVMKVFWIDLSKSICSALLFCCLGILMSSYAERWVDRQIPGRITVGGLVTRSIDESVRKQAHSASLPPSTGVMPAMLRLAMAPGSNGFAEALLSPLRAAQRTKAQIAAINKTAGQEASIVNMLAGAGTNVRSRAEEMSSLQQGLVAEERGAATSSGTGPPPATVPEVAANGATPAPVASDSVAGTVAVPAAVSAQLPAPASSVPAMPEPKPAIAAAAVSVPAARPSQGAGGASGLEGLTARERSNWDAARRQIRVSAACVSSEGAYVMIDGTMLHVGSTYRIVYLGREYAFRLRGVSRQAACKWDPVLAQDEPATDFIAF